MADAAMAASMNSIDHQDKQLVSLKTSWAGHAGGPDSQVSKKNLNVDEEKNDGRLSKSTQGSQNEAESTARDSICAEELTPVIQNVGMALGNNNMKMKTKGKENISRLSMGSSINPNFKKKPTMKKNMEELAAPKT